MDDFVLLNGPAAPPTANGELVLDAPWQGRVFAIAQLLARQGVLEWEELRRALIRRIAERERDMPPDQPFPYYDCVLEALESVLTERGLLDDQALHRRVASLARREQGHDHG
jgi:nitrile hydratase accessory protein